MKILKWILIIICFLNCLLVDIILILNYRDNSNCLRCDYDVVSILEIVIIFINFLFVIWVYFRDEKKDDLRRYQEKKSYWYHDILIQQNIQQIQDMFAMCIRVADEINDQNIKLLLREIKNEKKKIDNSFGYMLKAYNKELYEEFNNKLINFEDEFTKDFVNLAMREISKEDYVTSIHKSEVGVISILMNHDIEILKNSDNKKLS